MTLTLSTLRCPEAVAPETRQIKGGEFSIGRGTDNDWVLADPERSISKRHCTIEFRSGGWQIADLSTNGTFINRESEPIGRGRSRDLHNGDRLRFGAYEVEVAIASEAAAAGYAMAEPDPFALGQRANAAQGRRQSEGDPFSEPPRAAGALTPDPLLRPSPGHGPFSPVLAPASINLPADYDPLTPESSQSAFFGPTQSDHSPRVEDAFAPPMARSVLPEDWDRDDRQAAAREPIAAAAPAVSESMVAAGEPIAPVAPAPPVQAPMQPPVQAKPAMSVEAPASRPDASAGAAPVGEDLLAAFLRGAGLAGVRPGDPVATMEALGASFRSFVSGLRQAMITRAAIKSEFRIEQTIIRSRGNNPLKFSADDEDALLALLGAGRRSDMGAVEAVNDALRDLRLHELAAVAAMQVAARALLDEFEPTRLLANAGHSPLNLLSAQRKAHAWDAFEALYAKVTQALADDFDSVFGKAFARAYEKAVIEASTKPSNG